MLRCQAAGEAPTALPVHQEGVGEFLGEPPDMPAGRVRLLVRRLAAMTVLAPRLGQFAREYPDVVLDVTTDGNRVDHIAAGFDAGIQFGEFIQQDMVAVRVSPDHRPAIVGSPGYFESHPKPKSGVPMTADVKNTQPLVSKLQISCSGLGAEGGDQAGGPACAPAEHEVTLSTMAARRAH